MTDDEDDANIFSAETLDLVLPVITAEVDRMKLRGESATLEGVYCTIRTHVEQQVKQNGGNPNELLIFYVRGEVERIRKLESKAAEAVKRKDDKDRKNWEEKRSKAFKPITKRSGREGKEAGRIEKARLKKQQQVRNKDHEAFELAEKYVKDSIKEGKDTLNEMGNLN